MGSDEILHKESAAEHEAIREETGTWTHAQSFRSW